MMRSKLIAGVFIVAGAVSLWHAPAFAYLGPGAGLTAIGTLLALIIGMIVAVLGFIWYPIKRLLLKRNRASGSELRQKPQADE